MKKLLRMIIALLLVFPVLSGFHSHAKAAENEDIVAFAKKFNGSPYRYGGMSPSGFDCSGFVSYVYKQFGISLPRTAADQFYQGEKVSSSELVPGDLVYFTTFAPGPSHAGLYIGGGKFIHAASPRNGVMISSMDNKYFKSRYLGARRYLVGAQVKGATTLLSVKKGQIGMVTVTKKVTLWKRNDKNELTSVRVVKPGEKFRVYTRDNLHGGQFGLGSNLYITNIAGSVQYIDIQKH